ncbi:MAG: RNA methyltransferase [Crocinitomicaceae bacterium]|nr:RNA methyltransferase [Crocinitomicaceae bacterium]
MSIDEEVLSAFYDIISESKQDKYDRIAADRTRYITVAMEHIQKDHNASAVLRTCDCFGIQNLHAIEKGNAYVIQREIAKGAGSWVDLQSHTEGEHPSITCLEKLKNEGYQIVSTSPHTTMDINEVPIDKPIALVFGTEQKGISEEVAAFSDHLVKIPMYGFTESFNISVSAAIALNILRHRLEKSDIDWKLSTEEQIKLKIKWCTKIIRDGEEVEREIRKRILQKE